MPPRTAGAELPGKAVLFPAIFCFALRVREADRGSPPLETSGIAALLRPGYETQGYLPGFLFRLTVLS